MPRLLKLSIPAIAASLLIAACGSSNKAGAPASGEAAQTAGGSGTVVKTASNPSLGTILVNAQGMTLYHLSGEQNGKFICASSACVGVWHPLTLPSGGTPRGEVRAPDEAQARQEDQPLARRPRSARAGLDQGRQPAHRAAGAARARSAPGSRARVPATVLPLPRPGDGAGRWPAQPAGLRTAVCGRERDPHLRGQHSRADRRPAHTVARFYRSLCMA